ncbi:hypothetical protein ACFYTC_01555 [Actinomadura nitritigenes]|uniref:hypothetical protein n=1 Tax=Actinomadura nitritigenes TaxID=134602 RepID=UPI0036B0FAC9
MAVPNIDPLWQAFHFIVTTELSEDKVAKLVLRGESTRASKLTSRWKGLKDKLKAVVSGCVEQLKLQVTAVCDEALAETEGIEIGLGTDDYRELLDSAPAREGFAGTRPGQTYAYLLDQFISQSGTWQGFGQAYQKTAAQCVLLLQNCEEVEAYIGQLRGQQEKEYLKCADLITLVHKRIAELPSEPEVGGILQPLVHGCGKLLGDTRSVIDLCTGDMLEVRCRRLPFGFTDFAADKDLITSEMWPLIAFCQEGYITLKELWDSLQPPVFAELRSKVTVKYLAMLLNDLGWPGFRALLALNAADQVKLVARWPDLRTHFLSKCPSGSPAEEVLQWDRLAVTGELVDGWAAIAKGTSLEIKLPHQCTAYGWVTINGTRMPRAFSTPSFATDLACMKHCKQELGAKPTPQKMEAYFAELFGACAQAVAAWNNNDRPDMYPVILQGAVARWRIVVGSNGSRTVHHIDSGYDKSPWIEH